MLGGLRGTGIRLAVVDNLYAYGPTGGAPMREDLPYRATNRKGTARARVAERFMAAHAAGDVPVVIARASDYFGPEAADSVVGERFFGPIIAGKTYRAVGDPDAPHSVTYVPDFARAIVELARHDEAFGGAWHVPTAPAVSIRRLAELVATAAGTGAPRVSPTPKPMLHLVGLFQPEVRETIEMLYEFEEPFILDSSKIERAFGLTPTPFEVSIPATVAWWRSRRGTARART